MNLLDDVAVRQLVWRAVASAVAACAAGTAVWLALLLAVWLPNWPADAPEPVAMASLIMLCVAVPSLTVGASLWVGRKVWLILGERRKGPGHEGTHEPT